MLPMGGHEDRTCGSRGDPGRARVVCAASNAGSGAELSGKHREGANGRHRIWAKRVRWAGSIRRVANRGRIFLYIRDKWTAVLCG